MSHPIRWHVVALMGRRASLLVAMACVATMTANAQVGEAIDAANRAADTLAGAERDKLLAVITVASMALAAYFGWLDRSAIQVLLNKITQIEGHMSRMKCATDARRDDEVGRK